MVNELKRVILGSIISGIVISIYFILRLEIFELTTIVTLVAIFLIVSFLLGITLYFLFVKNGLTGFFFFIGFGFIMGLVGVSFITQPYNPITFFISVVPTTIWAGVFWFIVCKPLKHKINIDKNILRRNYIIVIALMLIVFSIVSRYEIKALSYLVLFTEEELLIKQLNGDGCGYLGACEFSVRDFSGKLIRHPEYNCPIAAAECMVKLNISSKKSILALKDAINKKTATFNTGDGIINYRERLLKALERIQKKN